MSKSVAGQEKYEGFPGKEAAWVIQGWPRRYDEWNKMAYNSILWEHGGCCEIWFYGSI